MGFWEERKQRVFDFPSDDGSQNIHVNLNDYPPPPIIWAYSVIDTLLFGYDWRKVLGVGASNNNDGSSSWLSEQFKVPNIAKLDLPKLETFADFIQKQQRIDIQNIETSTIQQRLEWAYKYAFETRSTALGDVTTAQSIALMIVMIWLIRLIKNHIVIRYFSKVGYDLAIQAHGKEWIDANTERIHKFGEYCFRLMYHTAISIYGLYFFWNEPWWTDMKHCFMGYPYHPIRPALAWYYLLQCSYNLDAFLSLLEISCYISVRSPFVSPQFNNKGISNGKSSDKASKSSKQRRYQMPIYIVWKDTVRGDFQEMLVHHVVTNALVIGSSFFRCARVGSMVFLVHDLSDVPVDLSKLANFVKWKITTVLCFLTMSGTWLYTRLYLFPFHIWWGSLRYNYYAMQKGLSPIVYLCFRDFFLVLMALLIILHALWFTMFIRIFLTILYKNEVHDYSEHKGGEPGKQPENIPRSNPNTPTNQSDDETTTANGTTNDSSNGFSNGTNGFHKKHD